jgi:hypothetical protein
MRFGDQRIELVELSSQTNEKLKEVDGLELLTTESKTIFFNWCNKIQVAKRSVNLNPLIIDYQNELTYRKARDEEHQFQDILNPYMLRHTKIQNRRNTAILSISVSDKQANRAFRIMDSLINSVNECGGTVTVEYGEKDNATFRLFDLSFSFQMTEIKVKRRSLLSDSLPSDARLDFKPLYEKIPSGLIEIEFTEKISYRQLDKIPKILNFVDSVDRPIEIQLGDVFTALLKASNEARVDTFISERKYEVKLIEQQRLREIEEDSKKKHLQTLEQNRLEKQLIDNIEYQMENWYKSQKLRKYTEELENFVSKESDDITKELLTTYISIVRQKAANCDPITDILNQVKAIGNKELPS